MSEPRISVEEVVTAYQETQLIPCPYSLFVRISGHRIAGCGLGALSLGICGVAKYEPLNRIYGITYVNAFANGFDGALAGTSMERWDNMKPYLSSFQREREGFWDGVAAGEAVKDGVPPKIEVPDYPPLELVTA